MERLIVLDTETTGLDVDSGHKIIEIGCIEIIDRNITDNSFHKYINPQRLIDEKAYEVHGISNEDLKDKPIFDDIIDEFALYISDSPLIIHNAPFDLGFLNQAVTRTKIKRNPFHPFSSFDTATLCGLVYGQTVLARACAAAGIAFNNKEAHSAIYDCEKTAEIFCDVVNRWPQPVDLAALDSEDAQDEAH